LTEVLFEGEELPFMPPRALLTLIEGSWPLLVKLA
jgi:hypothetical protein